MKHRFLVTLFGGLVPLGSVLAAASGDCSCDRLEVCTQANDIPIVFAARDMVRKKFLDLGAKLLEHGSFTDEFAAPEAEPYSHVTAFYVESRNLAQLSFSYPQEDFGELVQAYTVIGAVAGRSEQANGSQSWRTADGAEMRVRMNKGATFVDFVALAADARLDVLLKPGYRSPIDKQAMARPARAADAPALSIMASNPHQGVFEFHSEGAALLLGKHDLREEVCGANEDFDWATLDQHGADTMVDGKALYLDLQNNGAVNVKLALKDEFGPDIYRFVDVRAGKPTPASVDGDCRRRKVSVTYTPTHSPQCLVVNAINQPSYDVVQKLVAVSDVRVDGTELLPRETARVAFRDFELNAKDLLQLLGDVTGLEAIEKGPGHFEFRKPVQPAH